MNVYISSHCKWAARHVASVLESAGHAVATPWLSEPDNPRTADMDTGRRQSKAAANIEAIRRADALVLIASPGLCPGGKFVEAGAAIALSIPVVVVGRRENLLLWHPAVIQAETPEQAADALA